MRNGFGKQPSEWIARLSFTILRARLLLLLFLIPLPACGLILCFALETHWQGAQSVRKYTPWPWLSRLMVLPA